MTATPELPISELKFALLVDGDNISGDNAKMIMDEATKYGMVTIRNVYGDWTNNCLDKWKQAVSEYSLTPRQQFPNIKGKNATDSMLIIDGMDILYREPVDGFFIVSSDSDYTSLAKRLRQSGKPVIGMGNKQTHPSFRNSCTRFITLNLNESIINVSEKKVPNNKDTRELESDRPKLPDKSEIKETIDRILEEFHDDMNMVIVSMITDKLMNRYPDFSSKNYGYRNMSKMLEAWGYKLKSHNSNNYVIYSVEKDAKIKDEKSEKMSESQLRKEIEDIIAKNGEDRMMIGSIREELVKKYPSFKIKDYGYIKMRYLLKSLGFTLINDENNSYVSIES